MKIPLAPLLAALGFAAPALASLPSPPSLIEGYLYTRPIAVQSRGWVRVPLDLITLRHLAPGATSGGDLRVFGPSGLAVASRISPYLPGDLGKVEAGAAPPPSLAVTSREAECTHPAATTTVCRIALPASGQVFKRLLLEVSGGGEIGYRVYEPRDSRWRLLAEGVWPEGAEHALALPSVAVASDALRLELYGTVSPGPELKSVSSELAIVTSLFYAEEPGVYTLAYGGAVSAHKETPGRAREIGEAVSWVTPGPEQEHAPTVLPVAAAEPGKPLGDARFLLSWKLVAPDARPGSLVRLAIPPPVYGPAQPDLADVRLAAGDRQIPYLRWTPPEPVLVWETAAQPVRTWGRRNQPSESRVNIDLPQTGLPLTQLLLTTPPSPLRRGLSLSYDEPARPGVAAGERAVGRAVWECATPAPLPCRLLLGLPGRAPRLLGLRLEDGDNPPLTALDLALWRREDVLVFVWPAGGEVRLLAGARNLKAPAYDLAALGPQLLARPWRPAELDRSVAATPAPRYRRWVMPVVLSLATLLLASLLRQVLRFG